MKTVPVHFFTMLLAIFSWGCNTEPSIAKENKASRPETERKDSMEQHIPIFYASEEWKEYRSGLESAMNLYPIHHGVEGWEIRLSVDHVSRQGDSTQLFIFKKIPAGSRVHCKLPTKYVFSRLTNFFSFRSKINGKYLIS